MIETNSLREKSVKIYMVYILVRRHILHKDTNDDKYKDSQD